MARTVYVAMACTSYDGHSFIKAFEAKRDAEAFVDACAAHEARRPPAPDRFTDDAEGHAIYDAWDKRHTAWQRRHPAKPYSWANSFRVERMKLEPVHHA